MPNYWSQGQLRLASGFQSAIFLSAIASQLLQILQLRCDMIICSHIQKYALLINSHKLIQLLFIIMNSEKQCPISIQEYSVKLKKKYFKILVLYPAFNQTFVFLGMVGNSEVLVHCDKNGKILYEYKFTCSVDTCGMVDLTKAIVCQPKHNQISIFNLQTHERTTLPFQFMFQESDSSQIFAFSQSKYICIIERGRYGDSRFKLTYFAANLNQESKPLAVYESDSEWTYEYVVRKGNSASMVVWYKPRQEESFQIKQFHLDGVNSKYNHYITPNLIGIPYNKQKFQVAISCAWQISNTQFCLICLTEKSNYNLENQKDNNNNFIWDVQSNKIREAKFSFNEEYSEYLIDVFTVGKYSVFHTFSYHNGVAESSPIFYVHNKEERIVNTPKRHWKCTYLVKFTFPGYDTNLYVESEYENGDVVQFKMKIIKIGQQQN